MSVENTWQLYIKSFDELEFPLVALDEEDFVSLYNGTFNPTPYLVIDSIHTYTLNYWVSRTWYNSKYNDGRLFNLFLPEKHLWDMWINKLKEYNIYLLTT